MANHNNCENIEIIKKAILFLQNGYAFHECTINAQTSFFKGLNHNDYKKMDYKLKAIRQDFAKILVIMNSIYKSYSAYQKNEYITSDYGVMSCQATDELGCFIEYLFTKYRVMLEYVYQILEICIPPKFTEQQNNEYLKLSKYHTKYKFLLNYIDENFNEQSSLINMDWFQKIRIDRDFIIHDGATCMVFADKSSLLFKVMTTDAMEQEDIIEDNFFTTENGLIYYSHYWGLYISKLIVFIEKIFDVLLFDSEMSEENKFLIKEFHLQGKNELMDTEGNILPEKQTVLENMLKSIIR